MTPPGVTPPLLWFAAIVLVAANLRPVIASVPPMVDRLAAGLGLSAVAAGALTTLPVVCMGLFAPAAAVLAHRLGSSAVLAGAVALIGLGAAGRAFLGVARALRRDRGGRDRHRGGRGAAAVPGPGPGAGPGRARSPASTPRR